MACPVCTEGGGGTKSRITIRCNCYFLFFARRLWRGSTPLAQKSCSPRWSSPSPSLPGTSRIGHARNPVLTGHAASLPPVLSSVSPATPHPATTRVPRNARPPRRRHCRRTQRRPRTRRAAARRQRRRPREAGLPRHPARARLSRRPTRSSRGAAPPSPPSMPRVACRAARDAPPARSYCRAPSLCARPHRALGSFCSFCSLCSFCRLCSPRGGCHRPRTPLGACKGFV
jgi:hypothetical protein